jgi:hypothetical protein
MFRGHADHGPDLLAHLASMNASQRHKDQAQVVRRPPGLSTCSLSRVVQPLQGPETAELLGWLIYASECTHPTG